MTHGKTMEQIRNNNKSAYERRKRDESMRYQAAEMWKEQMGIDKGYQHNTRPYRRRKQKPLKESSIPNDFFSLKDRTKAHRPQKHHLREGTSTITAPPHKERNDVDLRETLNTMKAPLKEKREGNDIQARPHNERSKIDLREKITTPKSQPPNETRERRKIDPAELTLSSDSESESTSTRINYRLESTRRQPIRSVVVDCRPKVVSHEEAVSNEEKTDTDISSKDQPKWMEPILQMLTRQNEQILQLMERKSRKSSSKRKK